MKTGSVQIILDKATQTGVFPGVAFTENNPRGLAVSVSGNGSVSATLKIEVSDDPNQGWSSDDESTITVSGTTTATDYLQIVEPWRLVRATVISLSAGSTVTVFAGEELSSGTGILPVSRDIRAVPNATGGLVNRIWVGTQAQYDAIATKDGNTQYNIVAS